MITTNLTSAEFKTRYGERIADRIRECGAFHELAGESLRRSDTPRPPKMDIGCGQPRDDESDEPAKPDRPVGGHQYVDRDVEDGDVDL